MNSAIFKNYPPEQKTFSLGYIDDFITEIDHARDLKDIERILCKLTSGAGFEKYTYWLIWQPKGSRASLWLTNYPEDYIDYYIQEKFDSNDIVAQYSAVDTTPFIWSDVYRKFRLTPSQKRVCNDCVDAGMKAGASVPIHGPGAAKALFSVCNNQDQESFQKLFLSKRHELHLLSSYIHEKIILLGQYSRKSTNFYLTAREIEILTWASRGKTRWEISQILSISDETVKQHMDNASTKLGAHNKAHAIAVALINGLIIP